MELKLPARILALAGAVITSFGCTYQNIANQGTISAAPFSGLTCEVEDGMQRMYWDIPACECGSGIRMYILEREDHFQYRIRRGFRTETEDDDIYASSRSRDRLEGLVLGGEHIGRDDPIFAEQEEMFIDMWTNYSDVEEHALQECTSQQIWDAAYGN